MSRRTVIVYERVSTDAQDISRQAVQRERAEADYPGVEPLVIQDDGVSAYKVSIFDRPGGRRLCDLISSGTVEAVYVDAQDRLSRGADDEWVAFRALADANDTWIVVDGQRITRDLGGKALSYLRALLARQESDEKSHRVRSGMAAAAAAGRINGGPRRFGFEPGDGSGTLTPRSDEVAVALEMFRLARTGMPQTEIARTVNRHGHRTAKGHPWSQPKIGQLLRDRIWIGELVNQAGTFKIMEPVIDPELWHAVQRTLGTSGVRRGKPSAHFLLSHGLLRCGLCGSTMRVRTEHQNAPGRKKPFQHYSCSGRRSGATDCTQPAVRRLDIDGAVLEYFAQVGLDIDATIDQLHGERDRRLADVDRRLAHARSVLDKAQREQERVDALLRDGLTMEEWRRVSAVPQAEAQAATLAIEDLTAEREQVVVMDEALHDATSEFVSRLSGLRAAVAGEVVNAQDVAAAQAALRRVFEGFVLTPDPDAQLVRPGAIRLETGGDTYETVVYYELQPLVRGDAITPVPLSLPEEINSPSARSTFDIGVAFPPIPVRLIGR